MGTLKPSDVKRLVKVTQAVRGGKRTQTRMVGPPHPINSISFQEAKNGKRTESGDVMSH